MYVAIETITIKTNHEKVENKRGFTAYPTPAITANIPPVISNAIINQLLRSSSESFIVILIYQFLWRNFPKIKYILVI